MNNTEAGLLADIIEHPDDDWPRLVYADWLTDHNQPGRADFIRHQIARGKSIWLGPGKDSVEMVATGEYEAQTLAYAKRWTTTVLTVPDYHRGAKIVRGFLEVIVLRPFDWYRERDRLTREHPLGRVELLNDQDIVVRVLRPADFMNSVPLEMGRHMGAARERAILHAVLGGN